MNARDRILARLRRASRAPLPPPDVDAHYLRHRHVGDGAERLAQFRRAIEGAHAEVHDTDETGWPDLIAGLARARGVGNLLSAGAEARRLAATDGLPFALSIYDRSVDTWRDGLFDGIDASLTRARSAIAATGSLVLWPGPNEPRLLSLVPPIHFVLLDATAIHADLIMAMTAEAWAGSLPTNALLVSGPSKTADIQQTLAYGAHGPRELVVLLCHPAEGRQ